MPEVAAGLAAAAFTFLGILATLFGLIGSKPTIVSAILIRTGPAKIWRARTRGPAFNTFIVNLLIGVAGQEDHGQGFCPYCRAGKDGEG
jgi:hypothetical protein